MIRTLLQRLTLHIPLAVSLFLSLPFGPLHAGSSAEKSPMEMAFFTVTGDPLSLSSLKGKVVLVNFWATWCPPCKKEIPDLVWAQKNWEDQGLVVVGVNFMESPNPKRLRQFVQTFGINYPILYGDISKVMPLAKALGGVRGLPTSMVLDRNGKVIHSHTGEVNRTVLEAWMKKFL
ncbi:MAG: TlpA family protein disulfide reductase [Magnetococcales bacterium]|nr:TlpA family protein disulfide reductase [Magnetococcales bacterium]